MIFAYHFVIYLFFYICFFQIATDHHNDGTHTSIKLCVLQVSGGECAHLETMSTSYAAAGTSKF